MARKSMMTDKAKERLLKKTPEERLSGLESWIPRVLIAVRRYFYLPNISKDVPKKSNSSNPTKAEERFNAFSQAWAAAFSPGPPVMAIITKKNFADSSSKGKYQHD